MPLNGLRWSRNSGSANCDMPQSAVFGRSGGGRCTFISSNNNNIYNIYIIIIKRKEQFGGVCVLDMELWNYGTMELFLSFFFAQSNYFYYLCRTKNNNNPKPINPTNPNVMIIKHLQGGGLPTSASSVNAMCGACRHSHHRFSDSGM